MNKAPDAFRTISEVADYLETPSHVLRFWETRFPQVKPVKGAGGRRYYRPSDVALLAGIRRLLHNDGMTIRGVQKILRDQGVRHVAELGGEPVPAPEPLTDLLPPVRPPAEVVALRPAAPPEPEPADLEPLAFDPVMDLPDTPAEEALGLLLGGEEDLAALDGSATVTAEDALMALTLEDPASAAPEEGEALLAEPADDPLPDEPSPQDPSPQDPLAAIREALPAEDQAISPLPSFATIPGIGSFGLDLDVQRSGDGGFIAFSNGAEPASPAPPEGLVAPEARPKRTAPAAPLQTSLFDLPGVEEAPEDQALDLLEAIADLPPAEAVQDPEPMAESPSDSSEEAPFVYVDEEESLAEISAFPVPPEDSVAEETPAEVSAFPLPGEDSVAVETPAEISAFPLPPEEPVVEDQPADPDAAEPLLQVSETEPAAEALAEPALPDLAALAPRLRRLDRAGPEALFALADLQARLGLLHAQMVEAASRHRRPSA